MRAIVLVAVLLAPLAGCAAIDEAADRIRADPPPRPDYVAFFEDFVGPNYAAEHPFPVEEGALGIVAAINVTTTSPAPGPLAPPVTPIQITFALRTPAGEDVGEGETIQPPQRSAELRASGLNETGSYALSVTGRGLAGGGQGARYNVTLVVDYPS